MARAYLWLRGPYPLMRFNTRQPTPGFILVALIFLLLIGSMLLAVMAYLYGTAAGGQGLQNAGANAFVAAESGDQYGVYYLETQYSTALPPSSLTITAPLATPSACTPPVVTITATSKITKAGGNYAVQSVAVCGSPVARWTVVRSVTAAPGNATTGNGNRGKGKGTGRGKTSGFIYTVTGWAEQ